jgi:hypothetical protein
MIGCLRRALVLMIVLVVAALAWWYREAISDAWHQARGLREEQPMPSEALADAAAARIDSLAAGTLERAAFTQVELQSLLQYRYAGIMPAFVDSAQVELAGERIKLSGRLPLDRLPTDGALGELTALLPDTSEITLTGTLLPLERNRVALGVDQVTASRVPLPRRIVPAALDRLGRTDEPGLPPDAIALRLPPGVSSAYIRNDSLVLNARATPR